MILKRISIAAGFPVFLQTVVNAERRGFIFTICGTVGVELKK